MGSSCVWPPSYCRIPGIILWAASQLFVSVASGSATVAANVNKPVLNLPSYQNQLSHIEEAVNDQTRIADVRRSLPEVWVVTMDDRQFEVSTKQISAALWEIERDPKKTKTVGVRLHERLKLMQDEAASLEHATEKTMPSDADAKLQKVLNGREFQTSTGPSASELLRARINRWIYEHLLRLLNALNISERTGNFLAWLVIGAALVALFVVIYRRLLKTGRSAHFRAETEPVTSDARHWLQEALRAAERNDYREAIHCAYWAAVARLEDIRVLPQDRSRTPRESLRLLERNPKEQIFLRTITGKFELIWYGYHPATVADWLAAREQLERMGCLQASTAPTAPS